MLKIRVADTGRGISPDRLQGIFEPFPELKDAARDGRKYGGLGLAVNYRLAKLLGGRIDVVSQPNVGSTFTLVLPLNDELQPVEHARSQDSCSDGNDGDYRSPLAACKVLLVDANQQSQGIFALVMRSAGAELILANDGRQGFELAMSHRPEYCRRAGDECHNFDVVLVSTGPLPEMTAFQLADQLRKLGYEKPLVAIADHDSAPLRRQCEQAGFNEIVLRPFNVASLSDLINRLRAVDNRPQDR